MTLPANLSVYISALLFVLGAYFFALYLGMIVWAVRDIRSRSRDVLAHILTALLVAVFTLPGLLVYWLLRPHETLAEAYERSLAEQSVLRDLDEQRVCPGCQQQVEPEFIVCPNCHTQLRLRCVGCGRLLDPDWDVCPYCGLLREIEPLEDARDETEEEFDATAATEIADADVATKDVVVAETEAEAIKTVALGESQISLPILEKVAELDPEASLEPAQVDEVAVELEAPTEIDFPSENEAETETVVFEAPEGAVEIDELAAALVEGDAPKEDEDKDGGAKDESGAER